MIALIVGALLATLAAGGCGYRCGEGTIEKNGTCVVPLPPCALDGPPVTAVDGQCVVPQHDAGPDADLETDAPGDAGSDAPLDAGPDADAARDDDVGGDRASDAAVD
jgi:hypothetical protein